MIGKDIASLEHERHELNHLHHGQTGLPPDRQRLARLGYPCVHANKVVRVHDGMNKRIQCNGQVHVAIVHDSTIEPAQQKDGNVMIDMQKGELSPPFAQNNKDRVAKVPDLGHIKQPCQVGNGRVRLVVVIAGQPVIVVAVRQEPRFHCHVGTQHDLGDIVDKLNGIRINHWNKT